MLDDSLAGHFNKRREVIDQVKKTCQMLNQDTVSRIVEIEQSLEAARFVDAEKEDKQN